jgi:signal transduction histidine kinase/HAMP domain-containing protein
LTLLFNQVKLKAMDWFRKFFTRTFWVHLSLKTIMTVLFVVGMIALISIFGILTVTAARETTDRALQDRSVLAQIAANHADYVLSNVEAFLQSLATRPTIGQADMRDSNARRILPVRSLFLTDAMGKVIVSDRDSIEPLAFPQLIPLVQKKTFVVANAELSKSEMEIVAAVPVRDERGQFFGALVTTLDLNALGVSSLVQTAGLGKTVYAEILDADGLILYSTQAERLMVRADHGESFVTMIREGKSVVTTCHNCHDGKTVGERQLDVIAFAPLKNSAWGIVIRQAEAEVFGAARQLQGRVVLFGVIAVMGAVILVWLTTRYVIVPVQELKAAAERIARGDLKTPINVRRGDEIGALAETFEMMRGRLQTSIAEIQNLAQDLDRRVQTRTRELAALSSVAAVVTQPLRLDDFLRTMLEKVLRVADVDSGTIFLLSDDTRALVPQCCLGTSDDAANAMLRLHLDDSACGGVIEKGQPIIVHDLSRYSGGAGRALKMSGLCSLVHVPLISRDVTLGTMCVGTYTVREFDQEQVDLLMALGNQIAVGVENAQLSKELARREQLRGELLEKVITAQEEERKRIARDLHDDTSQSLTALIYSMEAAQATCNDPRLQQTMSTMRNLVSQTLDNVHKLIHDLRPSMLDHLGLFVALRWYAESRLQSAGMRVRIEERGALTRLSPRVETALFRVGQEAINNIARHSGARNVRVEFVRQNGSVQIEIKDDGIGFDVNEVEHSTDRQRGLGLVGMHERVGLLGGQINIVSIPGHGTHVSICVPVENR